MSQAWRSWEARSCQLVPLRAELGGSLQGSVQLLDVVEDFAWILTLSSHQRHETYARPHRAG